jgi:hypothetical protein
MPAKKATTRKTTTKKTTTKKTPTKRVTAAKRTDPSSSTRTNTATHSTTNNNMIATVLLILNTVLLLLLVTYFSPQKALEEMEAQRVGGQENYELIQQIYELDTFKQQQRFQIEQTLQALQGNTQQPIPTIENLDPEAQVQVQPQ